MRKFIPFNILLIFGNTLENTSNTVEVIRSVVCVLFYRANCVTRCANVVRMDAFTLDWNTLVELHRLFFLFLFLHQQQKKTGVTGFRLGCAVVDERSEPNTQRHTRPYHAHSHILTHITKIARTA